MNDILVSIRMPSSLLRELKKIAHEDHYMEVSEALRSIIRKNWFKYNHPESLMLEKLKKDLLTEVNKNTQSQITKQVIKELDEIKRIVKKEVKR